MPSFSIVNRSMTISIMPVALSHFILCFWKQWWRQGINAQETPSPGFVSDFDRRIYHYAQGTVTHTKTQNEIVPWKRSVTHA